MCMKCFPDHLREKVFDAGYKVGREGDYAEPFPVGAVLREDWERGMNKGMEEISNVHPPKKAKCS